MIFVEFDYDCYVVLQVMCLVFIDKIFVEFDLFVGFSIYEGQCFVVVEQEGVIFLFQMYMFDFVSCVEMFVEFVVIEQVFQFDLGKGIVFVWFYGFSFDGYLQCILVYDYVVGFDFIVVDFYCVIYWGMYISGVNSCESCVFLLVSM